MSQNIPDYVAAGYFISRYVGGCDFTGSVLRRTSLAADHSVRKFFPNSWALSWCHADWEQRIAAAANFGINEHELPDVMNWADNGFDSVFGAWSVFFNLSHALAVVQTFLKNAVDLELWGVGLPASLRNEYLAISQPPATKPGYAPVGASGVHMAVNRNSALLADGGTILGHELLIDDFGCAFNSPESLHIDEKEMYCAVGVAPNGYGLIDSLGEGLACSRYLESQAGKTQNRIVGWFPWLIVRYSVE